MAFHHARIAQSKILSLLAPPHKPSDDGSKRLPAKAIRRKSCAERGTNGQNSTKIWKNRLLLWLLRQGHPAHDVCKKHPKSLPTPKRDSLVTSPALPNNEIAAPVPPFSRGRRGHRLLNSCFGRFCQSSSSSWPPGAIRFERLPKTTPNTFQTPLRPKDWTIHT